MRKIFINDFGRLRGGWRALIYALVAIAALILLLTVSGVAYAVVLGLVPRLTASTFIYRALYSFSALFAALLAGYLCLRFLENLPWKSLGLTLHPGWLRDLFVGSAIGFAALAVAVAVAATGGGLRFSFNGFALPVVRSLIGVSTQLFFAALAEEAMFRGYGLQTLTRARLAWLGALLTSVPFGLAHLSNPNVSPLFTFINTTLAGLWFAAAYLRTRSLWLPLGAHWGWNWALGWVFGLPISGLNLVSNPLFRGTDEGPAWLTGGSYGIEGGLAGTVALTLVIVIVWFAPWIKATPEMLQLTSAENPAVPSPVLSIRSVDDHA
jgi:membrane protease YdiL (CAAX protease family)